MTQTNEIPGIWEKYDQEKVRPFWFLHVWFATIVVVVLIATFLVYGSQRQLVIPTIIVVLVDSIIVLSQYILWTQKGTIHDRAQFSLIVQNSYYFVIGAWAAVGLLISMNRTIVGLVWVILFYITPLLIAFSSEIEWLTQLFLDSRFYATEQKNNVLLLYGLLGGGFFLLSELTSEPMMVGFSAVSLLFAGFLGVGLRGLKAIWQGERI